jgi:hypothetical protein
MLSKCANPACSAQFRYLHDGKVFRVDLEERAAGHTPVRASQPTGIPVSVVGPQLLSSGSGRRPEYFWLCGVCCQQMTLGADGGSVVLMPHPKERPAARHAAAS